MEPLLSSLPEETLDWGDGVELGWGNNDMFKRKTLDVDQNTPHLRWGKHERNDGEYCITVTEKSERVPGGTVPSHPRAPVSRTWQDGGRGAPEASPLCSTEHKNSQCTTTTRTTMLAPIPPPTHHPSPLPSPHPNYPPSPSILKADGKVFTGTLGA